MCHFNKLDETSRRSLHEKLTKSQEIAGGVNFFLSLLEEIRLAKPHPLLAKNCAFKSRYGTLAWNKTIFKENLTLLGQAIQTRTADKEGNRLNVLPDNTEEKSYKTMLNMVRSLKPLMFTFTPGDSKEETGLSFSPFTIQDGTTQIDLLCAAFFFCHPDFAKEALKYKPKEE